MNSVLFVWMILFADGAAPAGDGGGAGGGGGLGGGMFIVQMGIMIVAFLYFFQYLPGKRERNRMATLLAGIKKNDHVVTASGIYGVVTDVNKETNKITLRIDESTGARMRVDLTTIVKVLGDEPAADAPSK